MEKRGCSPPVKGDLPYCCYSHDLTMHDCILALWLACAWQPGKKLQGRCMLIRQLSIFRPTPKMLTLPDSVSCTQRHVQPSLQDPPAAQSASRARAATACWRCAQGLPQTHSNRMINPEKLVLTWMLGGSCWGVSHAQSVTPVPAAAPISPRSSGGSSPCCLHTSRMSRQAGR